MKISKQLNRFCFVLVVSIFLFQTAFAEEKVENIWRTIETKEIKNKNNKKDNDINDKKLFKVLRLN